MGREAGPHRSIDRRHSPPSRGEGGSALIGALGGVAGFLSLMLVAVHVLAYLYATSVVGAVAFDAARRVSGGDHDGARGQAAATAEANARQLLGGLGQDASFSWHSLGPDEVVLTVRAESPAILTGPPGALLGLDAIERTVRVRAEGFR